MEFFTDSCLYRAKVSIDGCYRGKHKDGETLHVFQCAAGLHDISLEYHNGGKCRNMTQRVLIAGTNPFSPREVHFV